MRSKLPAVMVRKIRKPPRGVPPSGLKPQFDAGNPEEVLTGMIGDMKASAPEERLAKALNKSNKEYEFRYTMGAPRNKPGWFEVDFIVMNHGIAHAIEVDTEFTHRQKQRADVLHDARVLKALQGRGVMAYPVVTHVMGETDLVDQKSADAYVKRVYGQ
jgi:hypothetical protein